MNNKVKINYNIFLIYNPYKAKNIITHPITDDNLFTSGILQVGKAWCALYGDVTVLSSHNAPP